MKYQVEGFEYEITLDAQNKIFKFQTSDSCSQVFCDELLNKEIDEALVYLSSRIEGASYLAGWCTLLALKSARGDKVLFFKNPKRDQLICRCLGYSLTDLKSETSRADLKSFMRETSVGMVCTTCRQTLQAVYHRFESENDIIEGKSLQEWREITWALMPEFQFYSGQDIANSIIGINLIDFPRVKLVVLEHDEILNSESKKPLENRISNFLSQKLDLRINAELAAWGDSSR